MIKGFKFCVTIVLLLVNLIHSRGQGLNRHFLIGYDIGLADTNVVSRKGDFEFDSLSYLLTPTNSKMPFLSTQGNISDNNGNLLMVSNGCWIADATGDTMQNGSGLLPNNFTNTWCDDISGIPLLIPRFSFPTQVILIKLSYYTNLEQTHPLNQGGCTLLL